MENVMALKKALNIHLDKLCFEFLIDERLIAKRNFKNYKRLKR
jgi:hypothetical protein